MFLARSSALALLGLAACGASQKPAAPGCPVGRTVTIAAQEDADRIATCTELPSIVVRSGAPLSLGALRVQRVRGDLTVGPTVNLEELRLPELREVEGAVRVAANTLLRGVFLPRLTRAGEISVGGNSALVTLSTPALAEVTGALALEELPSLEMLDLSSLATVGQAVVITGAPTLAIVELAARVEVGALQLGDLRALDLDALRATFVTR